MKTPKMSMTASVSIDGQPGHLTLRESGDSTVEIGLHTGARGQSGRKDISMAELSKERMLLFAKGAFEITGHQVAIFSANDIKSLRPAWTEDQCQAFLELQAEDLRQALLKAGFEFLREQLASAFEARLKKVS